MPGKIFIWEVEEVTPIKTVAGIVGVAVKFKQAQEVFRFYDVPLIDHIGFSKFQVGKTIIIRSKGIGPPLGVGMIDKIKLSPFQYPLIKNLIYRTDFI